jgi:hypothetical protein
VRQQPLEIRVELGVRWGHALAERVGDPRAHAVRRDVDPLHRQDHVAELAHADEDHLGRADLLADLRDAVRVARALDDHLIEVVAIHRARLVGAEHRERRLLAERADDALRDPGQRRRAGAVLEHHGLALGIRIGVRDRRRGHHERDREPHRAHFFPNRNVIDVTR